MRRARRKAREVQAGTNLVTVATTPGGGVVVMPTELVPRWEGMPAKQRAEMISALDEKGLQPGTAFVLLSSD